MYVAKHHPSAHIQLYNFMETISFSDRVIILWIQSTFLTMILAQLVHSYINHGGYVHCI